MGKSLSLDIRKRIVSLVEVGHSCHEASRRLRISAASAVRIMPRRRRTGSVAPALQGRPRQCKLDVVSKFLKGQVEAAPDITMRSWQPRYLKGMRSGQLRQCCHVT